MAHTLAQLPLVLPGYDLSKFSTGDPNSIVYVAQRELPAWDFIPSSVTLIPGDANLDDLVDLQDFSILKEHFGQIGTFWEQGDFNDDGLVDLQDFSILKEHFGQSAPLAAVPEPATLFVVIGAAVPALLKRRRNA
jgi:hypothetical protein